jgi:hypothetical protein
MKAALGNACKVSSAESRNNFDDKLMGFLCLTAADLRTVA